MITNIAIKMKDSTIVQVDNLQARVHAPSRSDAVRRAVEISDLLVNAVQSGGKVIIEGKDGKQRQILISGLD